MKLYTVKTLFLCLIVTLSACSTGVTQGASSLGTDVIGTANYENGDQVDNPNNFYFEYSFPKEIEDCGISDATFYLTEFPTEEDINLGTLISGTISFPDSKTARFTPTNAPHFGYVIIATIGSLVPFCDGTTFGDTIQYYIETISGEDYYDAENCERELWDEESEPSNGDAFTMQQVLNAFGPDGEVDPFLTDDDIECIERFIQLQQNEEGYLDDCIYFESFEASFEECGIDTDDGGGVEEPVCDTEYAGCESCGTILQADWLVVGSSGPAHGLAFDGTDLWMSNKGENTVNKIDFDGTVLLSFSTPEYITPTGITFDGSGNLWIGSDKGDSQSISKMNPLTGDILDRHDILGDVTGLAFDGEFLWNAGFNNTIRKIDPSDGSIIQNYESPVCGPEGLTFDGTYLWHVDIYANMVFQIDKDSWTIVREGDAPCEGPIGLTSDGSYVYLTCGDQLFRIDLASYN